MQQARDGWEAVKGAKQWDRKEREWERSWGHQWAAIGARGRGAGFAFCLSAVGQISAKSRRVSSVLEHQTPGLGWTSGSKFGFAVAMEGITLCRICSPAVTSFRGLS